MPHNPIYCWESSEKIIVIFLDLSNFRHEDFQPCSSSFVHDPHATLWILKRSGLESSGRRLISLNGKRKINFWVGDLIKINNNNNNNKSSDLGYVLRSSNFYSSQIFLLIFQIFFNNFFQFRDFFWILWIFILIFRVTIKSY